ncbi:hypothetical protein A3I27_00675 [Candidatus Giovannonibacteria bacterium RIFCSPLOWO2_02_FULL_43_11b]|uniref:Uncharacterized protein n=1 Tax=Candidatus Giovannonibacteria bacterium RIFCSPHIGHO2_12_FULL_43_15 TaxID=1798341 RepID=A0A1F5WPP9_9BACT|nr:MAG: hypothetical protein A3B97_01365 [Candidatus Giovannonibacteria bacterium RIFCSPHIGHO2_02_FULL_43_32]OGF77600.1 MAG: hypothetical protein A3F23_00140 [Candidatus Giovannonibacteria bacterium RIFCSPHIGHO2_12_FULL_43_15]OGF79283.1 MAG: hypothetical protein A3A15_01435 [Candidatus Giovannonibacteria bacterium RIFCSPLOWO2_01_FULL_43_60]OGF90168.1 MAG: hypothetical protein A3I27_00675 [Candidatus Giovannonibacteria bacterium RIFCSPLOWO2_02_FULL_43_11b]OGF92242.1 MAG: hypothetical protein A3H
MILEKIVRTDVVSNNGPDEKIRPGEVPEFILEDDELKKIYSVLMQSTKNFKKAISDASGVLLNCLERGANPDNDKIVAETEKEIYKLATIHASLHAYFWDSLKYEHPQLLGNGCGIRENWQIVSNVEDKGKKSGRGSLLIGIPKDLAEKLMGELSNLSSAKNQHFTNLSKDCLSKPFCSSGGLRFFKIYYSRPNFLKAPPLFLPLLPEQE